MKSVKTALTEGSSIADNLPLVRKYMERKKHATLSELVAPEMANVHGTMFGGVLLSLLDKAAYVAATRWSRLPCVTASLDQVSFLSPVQIGEYVSVHAEVFHVGRSSMTIRVEAFAEQLQGGERRTVCKCFATMVAVANRKPLAVPPLEIRTPDQRRACLHGYLRKKLLRAREQELDLLEKEIATMDDASIKKALREAFPCENDGST